MLFSLSRQNRSLFFFSLDSRLPYVLMCFNLLLLESLLIEDLRLKISIALCCIFQVFSRVLRDSTTRFVGLSVGPFVGPSVGPSVGSSVRPSVHPSHFTFFGLLGFLALAPAQIIRWPQIWPLPTRTRLR